MCLSEQGYFDRKWGRLPTLGRLVGGKQPKDHWYGYSSAADNVFDAMSRLMEIYAVIVDGKGELAKTADERSAREVSEDLSHLASMLREAERIYESAARDVESIRKQLLSEYYSRQAVKPD